MIMAEQNEYKLVQFFLTGDDDNLAIYEVRLIKHNLSLTCTCPGYKGKKTCKHIKFIKSKLLAGESSNHYMMQLDEETPDEMIDKIPEMKTEEYRRFVAKYGSIEVL